MQVLDDCGFGDPRLGVTLLIRTDQVIQLGNPPHRIDLLTSISRISFDDGAKDLQPSSTEFPCASQEEQLD